MSLPIARSNYHAQALLCFILALSLNWLPATLSASSTLARTAQYAARARAPMNDVSGRSDLHALFGPLPLNFEANRGQTNTAVKFIARTGGYRLFLMATEAVIALDNRAARGTENSGTGRNERKSPQKSDAVVRMKLVGANPSAGVEGLDELTSRTNYFSGSDPSQWHTDIPNYARVRCAGVYPGIDMVYYGSGSRLEYDLVVAPAADPAVVELSFKGIEGFEIGADEDLILHTTQDDVRLLKPVAYQDANGTRRAVPASYIRRGESGIGFQLGDYDHSRPLIIDPVLVYSTYLGGAGFDQGYDIAVDAAGSAYVTGKALTLDFPTTPGAFQTSFGGGDALFISKFNPEGTALVYSTYINGASGNAIAVDFAGNAYVTGEAGALTFPTTPGAFQTEPYGFDTFVTKLNATGSALVYSARFGGNFDDFGRAIALDAAGNAYITGWTVCRAPTCTYPTVNAVQPNYGGGYQDAFVTKINSAGSALVYSTYLGGGAIINGDTDWGEGIAVDSAGSAYVTGYTYSPDFPVTPGAYDTTRAGLDAFLTKFAPDGRSLVYSTFFGGAGREQGQGIAVDSSGSAYVTGLTESSDNPFTPEYDGFPVTPGAFQTRGSFDAFVTKFNPQGSGLVYSTYLGGAEGVERAWGIAIDLAGNAYVTGDTKSSSQNSDDFPVANAVQPNYGGGLSDAFLSMLNPTGTALVYSTYVGGGLSDEGRGIAVDSSGSAYTTGFTTSYDFPVTPGAFQIQNGGELIHHDDAFVVKISGTGPTPTPSPTPVTLSSLTLNPTSVTGGSAAQGTVTLSGAAPSGGALITLASSNGAVASTPSSVTVAAGTTSAGFIVSTNPVSATTSVTISAGYGGVTKTAVLSVKALEKIAIQRAEYTTSKSQLRVDATDTDATATLRVYVTATGAFVGQLRNIGAGKYSGQFSWPVNPQNITVRSSLGGAASKAVTTK